MIYDSIGFVSYYILMYKFNGYNTLLILSITSLQLAWFKPHVQGKMLSTHTKPYYSCYLLWSPCWILKKNLLTKLVTLVIELPSITCISRYHTWSASTYAGGNLQHIRPINLFIYSKFTKTYTLQQLRKIMPVQASQRYMMQGTP